MTERRLQRRLKGQQQLSPDQKALLDQLAAWNERALRLVDDLLDASSLQTEGLHIALATSNLVQIVRDAIDDLQSVARPHTLLLEDPAFSDIPVMVDRVRIGQVVTQYLKNALKYTAEHRPITVGLALEGVQVRVWVRDAGPGLSTEQQHAIWERFRQVAPLSGYEYAGRGLGLGLSLCREIIRLHGGRTGVESVPGQGSTFWFTLPCKLV